VAVAQKQHVDFFRKVMLRQALLPQSDKSGALYVPFIGDGDLAVELYQGRKIYGADLNGDRVRTAQARLPDAIITMADCDHWIFESDRASPLFSVADFDAYSYPYDSFRAFWAEARKTNRLILFFTDGQRQAIIRAGSYREPEGKKAELPSVKERRPVYNFYWIRTVKPWFESFIKPWAIREIKFYLRGGGMLYWGAVIEKRQF